MMWHRGTSKMTQQRHNIYGKLKYLRATTGYYIFMVTWTWSAFLFAFLLTQLCRVRKQKVHKLQRIIKIKRKLFSQSE